MRRAIIALEMLLASGSGVYGLDPALDVNQYAHTAWNAGENFPGGIIYAIAQTHDENGLVCARAEVWLTTGSRFTKHWTERPIWDYYGYHENASTAYQDIWLSGIFRAIKSCCQ